MKAPILIEHNNTYAVAEHGGLLSYTFCPLCISETLMPKCGDAEKRNSSEHTHTHTYIVQPLGSRPFTGYNERLPADCNISAAFGE